MEPAVMPRYLSLPIVFALSLLAGCASNTSSRMGNAATTPLSDLNLMHADIPAVLQDARRTPYAAPANDSCEALAIEIARLDAVLGPDFDARSAEDRAALERGEELATDALVGAVQRTAEGVVPFRSWIRKLTGAEQESRRQQAAVEAGIVRRAFLKGVAIAHGCEKRGEPVKE